jgi:hypothetical protein
MWHSPVLGLQVVQNKTELKQVTLDGLIGGPPGQWSIVEAVHFNNLHYPTIDLA